MPGDKVMWIPRASSLRFLAERTGGNRKGACQAMRLCGYHRHRPSGSSLREPEGTKFRNPKIKKSEIEHPASEIIGLIPPSALLERGSHGAPLLCLLRGAP